MCGNHNHSWSGSRLEYLYQRRALTPSRACLVKGMVCACCSECMSNLMGGLRAQWDEVPHHVRVLAVGRGVPLLRMDKRRKKDGIPDEKYWSIVSDEIPVSRITLRLGGEGRGEVEKSICWAKLSPVALFSVKLHGKTTRISNRISTTALASNSWKA